MLREELRRCEKNFEIQHFVGESGSSAFPRSRDLEFRAPVGKSVLQRFEKNYVRHRFDGKAALQLFAQKVDLHRVEK